MSQIVPERPGPIRLYLLGSFRLERDGRTIHLPTRQLKSLFAYLALFPEPHSRNQLAALCWADYTDEQARHSLRTALTILRKKLGPANLITDRERVQLEPIWVDAREFEKSASTEFKVSSPVAGGDDSAPPETISLELYTGNLLPDFYDDWVVRERERLRALYLDSLLRLAGHYRAERQYGHSIECAQKVLNIDCANEHAHQQLMLCFAAQGDRIAALKQYDECTQCLRRELDVEPSNETTALRDQIRQELTGTPSKQAGLTNLPNPVTSFVGTTQPELIHLFQKTRLLTLTGVGGSGKTRLAIHIARVVLSDFEHGAWWVDLAPLSDPALVPQAVAQVLGVQESPQRPPTDSLRQAIHDRQMLVVLDNCEHLIDGCAALAEKLLIASPNLKIIATSREGLNIAGESRWQVPPLAVPDPDNLPPLERLTEYDAIELFVQRATAIAPHWRLKGHEHAVARICALLDGSPLAIELAAARVTVFTPEQIVVRLNDRFRLLTVGTRTALPRHQTLRALVDWSYDLLEVDERALLRALSVFVGGFTLQAAEVVGERRDVLDLVSRLVAKSLVISEVERTGQEMRYRLLETIRQYAEEKLHGSPDWEGVQNRHFDFFLSLAEQAEPEISTSEQPTWLAMLDVERANLRKALEWASARGLLENMIRLDAVLFNFWSKRGYVSEGLERLQSAMVAMRSATIPASTRAKALVRAGDLTREAGDYSRAKTLEAEGLALFQSVGDTGGIANSYLYLALLAETQGEFEQAIALSEQGLAVCREQGYDRFAGFLLLIQGRVARWQGFLDRAATLFGESLVLLGKVNDRFAIANALRSMAILHRLQGERERATALVLESLTMMQEMSNLIGIADGLDVVASMAHDRGNYARAVLLFAAVDMIRQAINVPRAFGPRADYDRMAARLLGQMGEKDYERIREEGRVLTIEQALELAFA